MRPGNPQQFGQLWYHASNTERLKQRKRPVSGNTGAGLHLGATPDAGRHERYDRLSAHETVAGNTIYPRMGRPFIHTFRLADDAPSPGRTSDHGVSWPYKAPERPLLYQNNVEDPKHPSLWADYKHLQSLGVQRNPDVYVTDMPESTVYTTADEKHVEQLKIPGLLPESRREFWMRGSLEGRGE